MRILRVLLILLICIATVILPSCGLFNGLTVNNTELKIGVSGISGHFNPFYCETEADKQIVAQTVRPVQRVATDNTLVNHSGGISYEFLGENSVKYTVSIRDDMMFSDGTNITIDDVIFYYHFISDATYDGVYKDWYLNDIEGIKEFYFDDKNYKSSIANIEKTVSEKYTLANISKDDYVKYLVESRLEGKFDGDMDSLSPDGKNNWKVYVEKLGYSNALNELGKKPTEEQLVKFVSNVEAEKNSLSYNPESWYREKLLKNYINKNYSDGIDITEISGIKKINDYTCTVVFNSRNINAVSQLNAFLVSKNYYSAEYIKGQAEKVKEINGISAVSSGPYIVTEYDDGKAVAMYNEYYTEAPCDFNRLEFVETLADDAVKDVTSGKIDVISIDATSDVVDSISEKSVSYFITNKREYYSVFFNSRSVDESARKGLMGLLSVNNMLEAEIGSYYTGLIHPMSIRFAEYPSQNNIPYYNEKNYEAYSAYATNPIKEITAYCCADENSMEYKILEAYKEILSEKKITLNVVKSDEHEMRNAILSGKADIWIDTVPDGSTCDKFDYYNSLGKLNLTGINDPQIDEMTAKIRSSIGFSDKAQMTEELLNNVMAYAIECPVCQLQTVTIYNTETINSDSLSDFDNYDGFDYVIPYLEET